jgi:hypothetical protein
MRSLGSRSCPFPHGHAPPVNAVVAWFSSLPGTGYRETLHSGSDNDRKATFFFCNPAGLRCGRLGNARARTVLQGAVAAMRVRAPRFSNRAFRIRP